MLPSYKVIHIYLATYGTRITWNLPSYIRVYMQNTNWVDVMYIVGKQHKNFGEPSCFPYNGRYRIHLPIHTVSQFRRPQPAHTLLSKTQGSLKIKQNILLLSLLLSPQHFK
jgi:hypothetical protein